MIFVAFATRIRGALIASFFCCFAMLLGGAALAATIEQETAGKIEQLRAIKAGQDAATMAAYNQHMDATWKFYAAHKPAIFPILRAQLRAEIDRQQPSDMVLLDVALFLHENDGPEGKALAREALFRLKTSAPVVVENWKELFELVHEVAEDHDVRALELIDRSFLTSNQKIFIPQHSLQLDGTLICVFLYGAYGSDVEAHLRAKLGDRSVSRRILEVLVWLGTPDSVQQVGELLSVSPTYETLARVTAYMMQAAGPSGRDFMLKVDATKLDPQARAYLSKIHPAVEENSFETIRASMAKIPGDGKLSDSEVKSRLEAMIKNYGKDDRTSPLAVLDSGLDPAYLNATLLKVRSLSLYRLSDEALSDVESTNALLNALRYRHP